MIARGKLGPGDRLLLFTDGLIEARSPSGGFVDSRALPARGRRRGLDSALDGLLASFKRAAGHALDDDLALLLACRYSRAEVAGADAAREPGRSRPAPRFPWGGRRPRRRQAPAELHLDARKSGPRPSLPGASADPGAARRATCVRGSATNGPPTTRRMTVSTGVQQVAEPESQASQPQSGCVSTTTSGRSTATSRTARVVPPAGAGTSRSSRSRGRAPSAAGGQGAPRRLRRRRGVQRAAGRDRLRTSPELTLERCRPELRGRGRCDSARGR